MQTCPQCGYTEIVNNKPLHNVMNIYVQESKPSYEVGLNRIEDEVIFEADETTGKPERKFIKKSVWEERNKPKNPSIVKQESTKAEEPKEEIKVNTKIGTAIPTPPITPTPPSTGFDAFGNAIEVKQP